MTGAISALMHALAARRLACCKHFPCQVIFGTRLAVSGLVRDLLSRANLPGPLFWGGGGEAGRARERGRRRGPPPTGAAALPPLRPAVGGGHARRGRSEHGPVRGRREAARLSTVVVEEICERSEQVGNVASAASGPLARAPRGSFCERSEQCPLDKAFCCGKSPRQMSVKSNNAAKALRTRMIVLLGAKCAVCGETRHLTFDCIKPMGSKCHRGGYISRQWFYWRQLHLGNIQLLCRYHQTVKGNLSQDTFLALIKSQAHIHRPVTPWEHAACQAPVTSSGDSTGCA